MATVDLPAGKRVSLPAPRNRRVFLYVVRGEVTVGGAILPAMHLADLRDDGDTLEIEATAGALLVFGHAEPLDEPVAAYGPFVMNTDKEIEQAIADYQAGRFGGL